MNASVLVIGGDSFFETLLGSIQNSANVTVEAAPNPSEAAPLIQAQQPDLLVLQAEQEGSLMLCQQIKAQSRLAWIYCIVIGDRPSHYNPLGDLTIDSDKESDITAHALEAGVDAFIWRSWDLLSTETETTQRLARQDHLFQAHVRAGLRRVQNYRELMRANDLLSAIALSDPLTELNNRRAFEWELPRQIRNAQSRDIPISLLMLDIDYFKSINDNHGHLVGDRALKLVSARLRHNLRFYDTPFRYGGEEFIVILSETGAQEALTIAQRLCRLISEQPFTIDDSLDLTITISAGTATLVQDDDEDGTSLIHRADQNLLKAKSQGRNRVVGEG
ncbi:MAG: GGDEF domain-containing response regulator [Elainellaceae cyanobacterium]